MDSQHISLGADRMLDLGHIVGGIKMEYTKGVIKEGGGGQWPRNPLKPCRYFSKIFQLDRYRIFRIFFSCFAFLTRGVFHKQIIERLLHGIINH